MSGAPSRLSGGCRRWHGDCLRLAFQQLIETVNMGPSGLFDASSIPVLEQLVNYSQARHDVLAGNIANLDTPGYRVRDLSPRLFQERMQEALERRDAPPTGGS